LFQGFIGAAARHADQRRTGANGQHASADGAATLAVAG
jgi:hypothetical protein